MNVLYVYICIVCNLYVVCVNYNYVLCVIYMYYVLLIIIMCNLYVLCYFRIFELKLELRVRVEDLLKYFFIVE